MPYVENQADANSTQELAAFHGFLHSSHTELALFLLHGQVFTHHPCWCLMLTSAGAFIKYICLYTDTFYRIGLFATQGNCSFRGVQVVPWYNSFPEKIKKSLNLAAWLFAWKKQRVFLTQSDRRKPRLVGVLMKNRVWLNINPHFSCLLQGRNISGQPPELPLFALRSSSLEWM